MAPPKVRSNNRISGAIIVAAIAAILLGLGVNSALKEQEQQDNADTGLPPDPFESNEPRVVDCVADWYSPRDPVITANVYCEVGDGEHAPDDKVDEEGLETSPYIWSSTAVSGQVVIIDMYVSEPTHGTCAIWVDGDFVESDQVAPIEDEENAPGIVQYYCGLEVTIT